MIKKITIALSLVALSAWANTENSLKVESHDDHQEKPNAAGKEDHKEDHKEEAEGGAQHGGEEHEHEEEGEHGGEEENAQVGPNKGITQADKEKGFKLSPEAEKNFGIKKLEIQNAQAIDIPPTAIATSTVEVNVYRFREGFYKRIDFVELSRSAGKVKIKSKELKTGDAIVISGLGFLRISEIAAFDGAPEGHSH